MDKLFSQTSSRSKMISTFGRGITPKVLNTLIANFGISLAMTRDLKK